jgi:hypothetical protein
VFLPVQLALWITAHLRDSVDSLVPLTSAADQPSLFLDSLPYKLPETDTRRTSNKGQGSAKGQGSTKGKQSAKGQGKDCKDGSAQPGAANKEKEGRIFRAHLRVQPPLVWPALPQWPHTLSAEERQQFQSYTHRLTSNSKATEQIISTLFSNPPNPISLALTIYEPDPLKSPTSLEGVDFSQHFVVQHYLSGPLDFGTLSCMSWFSAASMDHLKN